MKDEDKTKEQLNKIGELSSEVLHEMVTGVG